MALAFQNGGLIFSGGGLGQHPACCCPLPPGSARCDCSLFSTCTTTVEYDGLLLAFNSSQNFASLNDRNAGSESYLRFGFPQTQVGFGAFRDLACIQCDSTALQGSFSNSAFASFTSGKLCSAVQTFAVQYHLRVFARGLVGGGSVSVTNPYPFPADVYLYKYNLDQPPTAPCPGSLTGRTVTAQQVGSYSNGCGTTACGTIQQDTKDYDGGGFVWWQPASSRYDFAWNGQFVGLFDYEGELCDHPIWNQQPGPPAVSIACAP